jgi:hypothetical protein
MRMSRRPELFLKTTMFSFVGRKPQLAKVETTEKIENVSKFSPLFFSTFLALETWAR